MALIGTKLRELRKQRNLTLQQVADVTGFAVSFLSQLERDKVSVSVDNLERLARFYQVHMVHFFHAPEKNPIQITRRAEIQESLRTPGPEPAALTLLSNRADARIEPMLVAIQPGAEEPHFRDHGADTLLYILHGSASLISEFGEEIDLEKGDIASYLNDPKRRVKNSSAHDPLAFLLITSPPASSMDNLHNFGDTSPNKKG